jgi:hypothetical protein
MCLNVIFIAIESFCEKINQTPITVVTKIERGIGGPRHAEPTNFLNTTALPAWASPVVRLRQERRIHKPNQSISNTVSHTRIP